MKVKAKTKLIYKGEIYDEGKIFEMDEISCAMAEKYGKIKILEGAEEIEEVAELPPLEFKKRK